MNIRELNEALSKVLNEDTESDNLEFIERGDGYLSVYEKGDDGELLFEIEYNADDEYFCFGDDTKSSENIYYVDMPFKDAYEFIREVKHKNSYDEIMELIKKYKGYTVDYDQFRKEIRTYLK